MTTLPVLTRLRSAGAIRDRQVHTVDGGPLTSPACFCAIAACREDKPLQNAQHEKAPGRFGFFEFALVGVPLVIGTIAIVVLFGERLLSHRSSRTIPRDFSDHARTLVEQYALSDMAETALTRKSGVGEVVIPHDLNWPARTRSPAWLRTAAISSSSPCSGGERIWARGDRTGRC